MRLQDVLMVLALGALSYMNVMSSCEIRELKDSQVTGLQPTGDNLAGDVISLAQIDDRIMRAINRVGPDSVFISETYIPSESQIQYIVRTDTVAMGQLEEAQALLARLEAEMETRSDSLAVEELKAAIARLQLAVVTTEIKYDTHGTCLVPEVGIGLDTDAALNIEAGARLYYWQRFGLGVHGMAGIPAESGGDWSGSAGVFADYRIPRWDNVAAFLSGDYDFAERKIQGTIGVHVYLR
jgi:hypothetical protein